jgi:hypothetical protein
MGVIQDDFWRGLTFVGDNCDCDDCPGRIDEFSILHRNRDSDFSVLKPPSGWSEKLSLFSEKRLKVEENDALSRARKKGIC